MGTANTIERELQGGKLTLIFYPDSHRYRIRDNKTKKEDWVKSSPSKVLKSLDKPGLKFWAANVACDWLLDLFDQNGAVSRLQIDQARKKHTERSQEGKDYGKEIHAWIKLYVDFKLGKLDKEPDQPADSDVKNAIIAFLKWVKEDDVRFVASERPVYHQKDKWAGTLDILFTRGSHDEKHEILHLGDFKSGDPGKVVEPGSWRTIGYTYYNEHAFQTAAYEDAEMLETGLKFGDRLVVYLGKKTAEYMPLWIPSDQHKVQYEIFHHLIPVSEALEAMERAALLNPPILA